MTKSDPKFPAPQEKGRLTVELARLLRESYGERSSSIKRIAADLNVSERTVKNWYSGRNGPRGDHLIDLMKKNEEILTMVLTLSGRVSSKSVDELVMACEYLDQARHCLASASRTCSARDRME